jgi:hypothetical protein
MLEVAKYNCCEPEIRNFPNQDRAMCSMFAFQVKPSRDKSKLSVAFAAIKRHGAPSSTQVHRTCVAN